MQNNCEYNKNMQTLPISANCKDINCEVLESALLKFKKILLVKL